MKTSIREKLEQLSRRKAEIDALLGDEAATRDMDGYRRLNREHAEIEPVFSCLLCKMCEENCPSGVHIAENLRTLRHHINRTVFGLKEG